MRNLTKIIFSILIILIFNIASISAKSLKISGSGEFDDMKLEDIVVSGGAEARNSEFRTLIVDGGIDFNNIKVEEFRTFSKIVTKDRELFQTSSIISGDLQNNWQEKIGDILSNILPAGSITGTPKKSTIEILNNIELRLITIRCHLLVCTY